MRHVRDNAAESVRRVIEKLKDSAFEYPTDQGSMIKVKITVDKANRSAKVDFTGTSEAKANNFNAPAPVTRAAVLYSFRVMVEGNDPDERRVPGADRDRHPGRLDAGAAISARRRRRKCRDEPARDERAVRRARRACPRRRAR